MNISELEKAIGGLLYEHIDKIVYDEALEEMKSPWDSRSNEIQEAYYNSCCELLELELKHSCAGIELDEDGLEIYPMFSGMYLSHENEVVYKHGRASGFLFEITEEIDSKSADHARKIKSELLKAIDILDDHIELMEDEAKTKEV